jgi:hypothetical protein
MRKTPRTDAVWERFRTDTTGELEPDVEFSTLARDLEDELNNALEKINQLENAGDELLKWLTIDGVCISNQQLLANKWNIASEKLMFGTASIRVDQSGEVGENEKPEKCILNI